MLHHHSLCSCSAANRRHRLAPQHNVRSATELQSGNDVAPALSPPAASSPFGCYYLLRTVVGGATSKDGAPHQTNRRGTFVRVPCVFAVSDAECEAQTNERYFGVKQLRTSGSIASFHHRRNPSAHLRWNTKRSASAILQIAVAVAAAFAGTMLVLCNELSFNRIVASTDLLRSAPHPFLNGFVPSLPCPLLSLGGEFIITAAEAVASTTFAFSTYQSEFIGEVVGTAWDWATTKAVCEGKGDGYSIATLPNMASATHVLALFSGHWVWLGGDDQADEGKWRWSAGRLRGLLFNLDGTQLSFFYNPNGALTELFLMNYWSPSEPNNSGNNEDCYNAALTNGAPAANDLNCAVVAPAYACERSRCVFGTDCSPVGTRPNGMSGTYFPTAEEAVLGIGRVFEWLFLDNYRRRRWRQV